MGIELTLESPINERFIEILLILVNQEKLRSLSRLGELINEKPQSFTDIKAGKKRVQSDLIDRLCVTFPNVNKGYINAGILPRFKSEKFEEAKKINPSDYANTIAPLISQYAAAGYLMGYSDPEYIEQQPVYVAAKKYSGGNYVAFEIRGDSMDDGLKRSICNSDVILGKELRKDYWKCKLHIPMVFIIVHKTSGILCKEIIDHDVENGIITCHSYNPANRDFELSLNEVAQLFYLKEITREP